tara:strand:+ start:946 stop:1251 length:306 start_codon:yes stop_codon:yes gene_type:complete
MPYTPEELQNLPWYQNLIDEDEQKYLIKREFLLNKSDISGSAYDGSLMARDESNTILLFENPYTNELRQDPSTMIVFKTEVNSLKKDENINNIIARDFEEL